MGGFLEEQTEATKYLEYLSILEKIDSQHIGKDDDR